jgi:hypothetical protein
MYAKSAPSVVVLALGTLLSHPLPARAARLATLAGLPTVARPEPRPEINRAIVALEKAKWHLQHAAHDFGGHRVAAIAAIDAALGQLRLALQFDKH